MSSPGLMFVGLLSPSQELPLTNTKLVTTKTTPYFGAISTTFNNSNDLSCEKNCLKKKTHIVKIVWISVSPLVLFADRWLWECHRPFGLPASQGLGIEPAQMNFPRSRVPMYVFSWHLLTVFDFLYYRCSPGYSLGEMIHSRIATEKWLGCKIDTAGSFATGSRGGYIHTKTKTLLEAVITVILSLPSGRNKPIQRRSIFAPWWPTCRECLRRNEKKRGRRQSLARLRRRHTSDFVRRILGQQVEENDLWSLNPGINWSCILYTYHDIYLWLFSWVVKSCDFVQCIWLRANPSCCPTLSTIIRMSWAQGKK